MDPEFAEQAKKDLKMLRNDVASQQQFETMATSVIQNWIDEGETQFATSIRKEYMTPPFNKWSVNSFILYRCMPIANQIVESGWRTSKRINWGAGFRNMVGVSEFATFFIFVMLKNLTEKYSGRSITVEATPISTSFPTHSLHKCQKLLVTIEDTTSRNSNSSSQKKLPVLTNYYEIKSGTTLKGTLRTTKGYFVFNSSKNLVQDAGPRCTVTRKIALTYLHSALTGEFPTSYTYQQKKDLIQGYHAISYEVLHRNNIAVYEFNCDCVSGRHEGECGHEAAAQVLLKIFDVARELQEIDRGNVKGRPRKIVPVGYRATRPEESLVESFNERDATNFIGEPVIQFFELPHNQKAFVGKITGRYKYQIIIFA